MPFIHPGAMPWRGADIMNGLISIDITFEGPEHGGIGSTIFSQAFVHEVCTESNLPPEATAAVQMIMVIKELPCGLRDVEVECSMPLALHMSVNSVLNSGP